MKILKEAAKFFLLYNTFLLFFGVFLVLIAIGISMLAERFGMYITKVAIGIILLNIIGFIAFLGSKE